CREISMSIVKSGIWLYDDTVEKPVDIVALDYDWWYEMVAEEDGLEEGEKPGPFDENGLIYYVRFRYAGELDQVHWADSIGHTKISDAVKEAESKVQGGIRWLGENT
ncbi:hypothetical protein, partial [Marinimicrobium sp. ABcell2]|uniref:hypothetical protein n=1 Tax=Marinimicrobium sp. ABcell2 TaxID=3069751 RepID=UPI0027AE4B9D